MTRDGVERRGARRVPVECAAWIEPPSEDPRTIPCRTVDLSATGVRLTAAVDLDLTVGARNFLAIDAPAVVIAAVTEVVHVDPGGTVGVRFAELPPGMKKLLEEMVESDAPLTGSLSP